MGFLRFTTAKPDLPDNKRRDAFGSEQAFKVRQNLLVHWTSYHSLIVELQLERCTDQASAGKSSGEDDGALLFLDLRDCPLESRCGAHV